MSNLRGSANTFGPKFKCAVAHRFHGKKPIHRNVLLRTINCSIITLLSIFISAQGMDMMERGSHVCNKDLVQSLMFDAVATENFQDLKPLKMQRGGGGDP